MNLYFKTVFFISILMVTFFEACSNKNDINEKVQGNWVIKNASRNGRITYTLEGAYLKLYNNNALETNISGSPVTTNYIFKENILIPDSFFSNIFVDKVIMDTLWLHMTISDNLFSLQLINSINNEKNTFN